MNYIYLDSKIYGAALQLGNYFRDGVFDADNTIVYYKKYNVYTKKIDDIFKKYNITAYPFSRYSDINMENGGVVFYLFNAQSNCRMVANRNLKHIFITHGESNKVSSVKPITRIYDHVVSAGQMGINRYINHKIFYKEDVKYGRLLTMGDTFAGTNAYRYDKQSKSILYAPTWEGGLSCENYSSLAWDSIFQKLYDYMKTTESTTLIIQPHPNLGHRTPKYVKHLYIGIAWLIKQGQEVVLVKDEKSIKDIIFTFLYKKRFCVKSRNETIAIKEGFCDISAMEAQLYAKKLPVRVFIKQEHTDFRDDILSQHYKENGILKDMKIVQKDNIFSQRFYDYMFDYSVQEIKELPLVKRVEWLVKYTNSTE